jgi:hypothetical protein
MLGLFPNDHPSFAIMHVGRANIGPQQVTRRVKDQKPFAVFDEFAPVKANLPGGGIRLLYTT